MARVARKSDAVVKRALSAKTKTKGVAARKKTAGGMNTAHEKEKLSVTLDKSIVGEIRTLSGGRPLSTSINALLRDALAQHHLGELVAEMEQTAGPVKAEAYERVFSQWFEEE